MREACLYCNLVPPMRFDWAPVMLGWGLLEGPAALLEGTAALLGSLLSSVGRRSLMTPLSSEGAGWCAALVTKACTQHPASQQAGSCNRCCLALSL